MPITHIHSGPEGQSHFEEVEAPFDPAATRSSLSPIASTQIRITRFASGHTQDFHNAPVRQLVVVLSGRCEVTTDDGSAYRPGPGDIFFANDMTGHGHTFREIESPLELLTIPVADDFDLAQWRSP
jgi:quercetin dioxygenase-like cupin family protein